MHCLGMDEIGVVWYWGARKGARDTSQEPLHNLPIWRVHDNSC
jgi:hypothetical protein